MGEEKVFGVEEGDEKSDEEEEEARRAIVEWKNVGLWRAGRHSRLHSGSDHIPTAS